VREEAMTSVLDSYFGSTTMIANQKVRRTSFPRAEEELRPLLDAFLTEVRKRAGDDYELIDVWRKRWVAGARDLVRVMPKGTDPDDFMPWAFEQFERSFPDQRPISPRSIMYLTTRYKAPTVYDPCPDCGAIIGHALGCSEREET
jgi:hypothetical protein